MKVICKKFFKNINIGDIVEFTHRDDKSFRSLIHGRPRKSGEIIGAIFLPQDNIHSFIVCEDFNEHFCTIKEYRKLKLEKLNEKM